MANTYLLADEKTDLINKLVSSKFDKSLKDLKDEMNNAFDALYEVTTPKNLKEIYKQYPDFFNRSSYINLSYNPVMKHGLTDEVTKKLKSIYCSISLKNNYPICDGFYKMVSRHYDSPEYKRWIKACGEYINTEHEKVIFKQKLECLFKAIKWTPTRLKNDFPEAYELYQKMKSDPDPISKNPNLCDSVESIRATLNSKK